MLALAPAAEGPARGLAGFALPCLQRPVVAGLVRDRGARWLFRQTRAGSRPTTGCLLSCFRPRCCWPVGGGAWSDEHWVFDFQESVSPQFRRFPRRSPLQKAGAEGRLERLERRRCTRRGGWCSPRSRTGRPILQRTWCPSQSPGTFRTFSTTPVFAEGSAAGSRIRDPLLRRLRPPWRPQSGDLPAGACRLPRDGIRRRAARPASFSTASGCRHMTDS